MRLEHLLRDFTYAVARLRKAPLFVAVVAITFALGIGANVAVFSAFNAIVLRPLPFTHAQGLVSIGKRLSTRSGAGGPLTELDVNDLRSEVRGTSSISAVSETQSTLLVDGVPQDVRGATVSSNFFATIDASPQLGRAFMPIDAQPGQHVAIISDRLWRTHFNGDSGVIGKQIQLSGISYSIVGVAPANFEVPVVSGEANGSLVQADYLTVIPQSSPSYIRGIGGTVGAVASLAPGTTVDHLNAELALVSPGIQTRYPHNGLNAGTTITFEARPLAQEIVGPVVSTLAMVLAAVFGVLLIACANVANLIAARWSSREREVAIRRALGATNGRIAMQLFVETGILACFGGILGVALAYFGLRLIPVDALSDFPRAQTISIDGMTLLYALLMVCVTTTLSGISPVLALGRGQLQAVLGSGGRSGDASRGHRSRSALVVAEIAIALALVVSSALVVRSFLALTNSAIGVRTDGVYVTGPVFARRSHVAQAAAQEQAREQRLLSLLGSLPGVDHAAMALSAPLEDYMAGYTTPSVQGQQSSCEGHGSWAIANMVSPGYFQTIGVPLLHGREFSASDSAAGGKVIVVNQAFVDKFWHGGQAIGQSVGDCTFNKPAVPVVGVVPNIPERVGAPAFPEIYAPLSQQVHSRFVIVLHAPALTPASAQSEFESAFRTVYPDRYTPKLSTITQTIASATKTQRFAAVLLGTLASISLILSLCGIYGVVAYSTEQRFREFGIRMALGAQPSGILLQVLQRSLGLAAIGVAIGVILAALDAREIAPYLRLTPDTFAAAAGVPEQQLVQPIDPWTFALVILLVLACTVLASAVPALRATRVNPVVALRYE